MTISFNGIPVGVRTPGSYVEFSNVRTINGLAVWPTAIMILGQMLAGGSAAPYKPVQIYSPLGGQGPFGQGSMLDRMIQASVGNNSSTPTFAMALPDNGAGVAATQTITVTEQPTVAATIPLYVAGQAVDVGCNAGDALDTVAASIAAAIEADDDLPVTAVSVGAVVTTTCKWKGLTGNGIDIRTAYYASDVMPTGLALTIAAGVAGSGDPDIAAALAALGATQYNFIVHPWTSGGDLAELATELAARRGPMQQIDGVAFSSAKGSMGTLASLGATMNSPDISISECTGPTTPWERAARECAVIALNGTIDPARPFQTLPLAGDMAPNQAEAFTPDEVEALLHDGISPHAVGGGGAVELVRPITTYQTNAAGAPDASYLDVNTMLTLSYLRYSLRVRFAQKFPRMKLADDGITVAPGQAIVTPKTLTAELIALAGDWQAAGLVENLTEFASLLVVQRNANDPSRVDALIPPDIVSGLRVFAAQIQFAF